MNKLINNFTLERALRLFVCVAVVSVFCAVPAFADNEYAQKGAQWILDAIYWIALVFFIWNMVKSIAARNWLGTGLLFLGAAFCIALIARPELLKTVGEKLTSIVGLS